LSFVFKDIPGSFVNFSAAATPGESLHAPWPLVEVLGRASFGVRQLAAAFSSRACSRQLRFATQFRPRFSIVLDGAGLKSLPRKNQRVAPPITQNLNFSKLGFC
jgi:hypothetical protein